MAESSGFDPTNGRVPGAVPLAREPRRSSGRSTPTNGEVAMAIDAPPRLRLVDEHGSLVCDDCQRSRHELEVVQRQLEDAERELRQYRAKVRLLTADKARERNAYVKRTEIEMAMSHWRILMEEAGWTSRRQCKLSPERYDAIRQMLEVGYTVVTIDHASLYISRFPWPSREGRQPHGSPDNRRDDIRMICERGDRLEEWARRGATWKRQNGYEFPWGKTVAPPARSDPNAPPLFAVPAIEEPVP